VVVSEVADCIIQLFRFRSKTGGSLYNGPDGNAFVGPIVATPFYRALDGVVRFAEPVDRDLAVYRGPFGVPSEYLRSFLDAELHLVEEYREHILEHELDGDEESLEQGIRVLNKAVQLSSIYPGNICVSEPLTSPGKPFSLRMDDFRLSNIMIDEETGHITALLDFEGATVAPLWECAYMPRWLQSFTEWDGSHEGGSPEEKETLRNVFLKAVAEKDPSGEWIRALERGRPFRELTSRLSFNVGVWADMEEWVDERIEWARKYPGKGHPSNL
ncbi:hypothetical protein B0H11DRAFT_495506, partial [Mycena galericulata]